MSWFVSFPLDTYKTVGADAFKEFVPKPDFTIGNARAMMWFAQLTYEYDKRLDSVAKLAAVRELWKFDSITPIGAKKETLSAIYDAHGIIGERQDAVLLAFAGTDPFIWETVVTDILAWSNKDGVHRGFASAEEALKDGIAQATAISKRTGKPVFISGHSLGASMAALAAWRAVGEGRPPMSVYTYGMPRTGTHKFKAPYDAKLGTTTYRLVNGPDVVPTVPVTLLWKFAYRHVGRLLRCDTLKTFDAADLSTAMDSNEPGLGQSLRATLGDIRSAIRQRKSLSPKGPGDHGAFFKTLPLNLRQHLQDQYLRALGVNITFD